MTDHGLLEKLNAIEAQVNNVKSLLAGHEGDKLAAARLELLELANNLEYVALGPTEWLKASFAVVR
jgi:hypothetical protein